MQFFLYVTVFILYLSCFKFLFPYTWFMPIIASFFFVCSFSLLIFLKKLIWKNSEKALSVIWCEINCVFWIMTLYLDFVLWISSYFRECLFCFSRSPHPQQYKACTWSSWEDTTSSHGIHTQLLSSNYCKCNFKIII